MNMQKDKQTVILARKHVEGQDDRNTGEGTRRRAGRLEYHRMNNNMQEYVDVLSEGHAGRNREKTHAGQVNRNTSEGANAEGKL
jgi:hypothetical protein